MGILGQNHYYQEVGIQHNWKIYDQTKQNLQLKAQKIHAFVTIMNWFYLADDQEIEIER